MRSTEKSRKSKNVNTFPIKLYTLPGGAEIIINVHFQKLKLTFHNLAFYTSKKYIACYRTY